jgi:hypothetical protein
MPLFGVGGLGIILSFIIPGNNPNSVPGGTIFYLLQDKNTPLPAR